MTSRDTRDPPGERDDDLHDPALRRLYRALPPELPSPDTDARLKAAARRAVAAGPRAAGRPFLAAHWRAMAASAAALVMGVALTVQWQGSGRGRLDEALATLPPAPAPAPATSAADSGTGAAGTAAPPAAAPARREPASRLTGANGGDSIEALEDALPEAAGDAARATTNAAPPVATPAAEAEARAERELASDSAVTAEAKAVQQDSLARQRARKMERLAEAAPAPAAPPPAASAPAAPAPQLALRGLDAADAAAADYRERLRAGDLAGALAALVTPATPAQQVDRDLLLAAQAPQRQPDCARQARSTLGAQAALCDALQSRAVQGPLAPAAQAALQASGLLDGEFAYRRELAARVLFFR
ncbi:MAG TPA: hypothetical protein VFV15_02290 [Moraxellaceae bacterium]|nr:hypothetical protein [Moraxellaceae bacterium]